MRTFSVSAAGRSGLPRDVLAFLVLLEVSVRVRSRGAALFEALGGRHGAAVALDELLCSEMAAAAKWLLQRKIAAALR